MTYKLEEFKEWLKHKPDYKKLWEDEFSLNRFASDDDTHLEKLIKKEEYKGLLFRGNYWDPHRKTVLEWMAEVDNRERERERESRFTLPKM